MHLHNYSTTGLLDSLQKKENLTFFSFKAAMTSSPPSVFCNLCNRVKMWSSSLMIWTHTHTRARRPLHASTPCHDNFLVLFGVVFIVQKQNARSFFFFNQVSEMWNGFLSCTLFFLGVWLLLKCMHSLRLWQMITFQAAVVFLFSDLSRGA